MARNRYDIPPEDHWGPPLAPGQHQAPSAPRKRSVGRRILATLGAVIVFIAAKVGLHMVMDDHHDRPSDKGFEGFDYAIGTCLNLSKAGIMVKPGDVSVEPCSSATALAKVAQKYKGAKNCPNDNYGTLEGGGSGLCLQDNLTVGNCYHQTIVSHLFAPTACTPGIIDSTFKVALRRDGVNDPGLCTGDQQVVNFPEPALTYCLDVLVRKP